MAPEPSRSCAAGLDNKHPLLVALGGALLLQAGHLELCSEGRAGEPAGTSGKRAHAAFSAWKWEKRAAGKGENGQQEKGK